jgi:hypothetical protein
MCLICSNPQTDRCHIKSKGSGGKNEDWNLIQMCRAHHSESHTLGWYRFSNKYDIVRKELDRKGWEFVDRFGFPKLVRKPD